MLRSKSRNKGFIVRPFDKLKKKMAVDTITAPSPPPCRKKKEEYTDDELFMQAMDQVRENEDFRALSLTHGQKKPAPCRKSVDPDRDALAILHDVAEGRRPMNLPDTQEYVAWENPAYHCDLTRQLHEGQFSIQAFLDLHGYTVSEAEAKLETFIKDALQRGLRCVKIIHGRGLRSVTGPRLKGTVTKRLSGHFRNNVIAYVTARQCDGGLGALYVLLGKTKRINA
jgi:DNA-nicking Smr family endonuclease